VVVEDCGRGQTEAGGDYENSAEAVAGNWGGISDFAGTDAGVMSALAAGWSSADLGKDARSSGSFAVDSTYVADVRGP
jgi:hypothetical protein